MGFRDALKTAAQNAWETTKKQAVLLKQNRELLDQLLLQPPEVAEATLRERLRALDRIARGLFGMLLHGLTNEEQATLARLRGETPGHPAGSEEEQARSAARLERLRALLAVCQLGDAAAPPSPAVPPAVATAPAPTASAPQVALSGEVTSAASGDPDAAATRAASSDPLTAPVSTPADAAPMQTPTPLRHGRAATAAPRDIRCEACQHFRPRRSVVDRLSEAVGQDATLSQVAQAISELRSLEEQGRAAEARTLADQYRMDKRVWGVRPRYFSYCAAHEHEHKPEYVVAQLHNIHGRCPPLRRASSSAGEASATDFQPADRQARSCATCTHRVAAPGPTLDRLDTATAASYSIGPTGPNQAAFSWMQQVGDTHPIVCAKELKEAFLAGPAGHLQGEPRYLDHCAKLSRSARGEFRVCAVLNLHDSCPHWRSGTAQQSPTAREREEKYAKDFPKTGGASPSGDGKPGAAAGLLALLAGATALGALGLKRRAREGSQDDASPSEPTASPDPVDAPPTV
jgi:hypothetical protein